MDCKKIYCTDEIDTKKYFETYYSAHTPYSILKESTINMLGIFHNAFSTGMVSGRTAIDCSVGPTVCHLFAICDFVQKITVLKVNDASLKELEKWKNKDPKAYDWAHATEILQQFKRSSEELEDKEEKLRGKIDQILKWDLRKGNPVDVLSLTKAGIIVSYGTLEMISKDHDDYRRNLRKMSNCIKPGGYYLSYACTNASYLIVGEDKFHFLPCDERFYRKAINEGGFEIEYFKKFDRVTCSDLADHEGMTFIIAHKMKL